MTEQHHEVPDLRGKQVTCTRCGRTYQCLQWDDFYDPRDDFGWIKGGVDYDCLIALYNEFRARNGPKLPLRADEPDNRYRQQMMDHKLYRQGKLRH